ncbi:hypothetical protein ACQV2B_07325 [Pantoea allii]|uniref:hypothetical protein n=1 Tax=Pantoea allii TaxID=574096 RepID=UPI00397793A8
MSLYYGVKPKTATPPLLRRKRKIDLQKLYDFIKTFLSVLVKRPTKETQPEPATGTVPNPAVPDPLDEVMIDPVTKLKITKRQWEAMGTGSKSAEVSKPLEVNYEYKPGKNPNANGSTASVAFPPLPRDEKAREFNPVKNPIKSIHNLQVIWKKHGE